jgi:flagellar hook assembly protein FlgD
MVGEWGYIYRSHDGGSSWDPFEHEATSVALKSVTFSDHLNGWAAGRGGTIIKIDNAATGIHTPSSGKKSQLQLQNYPNPFSSQTTISFHLIQPGVVNLSIYDLSGRHIVKLVNERKTSVTHTFQWRGTDNAGRKLSSGIYVCKLISGTEIESKIIMMVQQ